MDILRPELKTWRKLRRDNGGLVAPAVVVETPERAKSARGKG